MPTYDYRCKECGHQFEVFQAISAEPIKKCPVCGSEVERLIGGGAGLVFKGSGFYITDYKNKKDNTSPKTKPDSSTPAESTLKKETKNSD
ncbi:zinc ribbon domain-containing protein [candidate division KSB1 bacterium]|nr:zinc ribbon domain-containing protein [candidate division KSB1 bacterium]RQW00575.1 MAG: zinc ribbon domain-containing protein [candidate division KSB1 bacterium]